MGFGALAWGLLFLTAFLRNETDTQLQFLAIRALVGAGAILSVVGLLYGSISEAFLLPKGVLLAMLGLYCLWALVEIQGAGNDSSYRLGWLIGLAGLVTFLIALGRSALPSVLVLLKLQESGSAEYLMPSGIVLMGLGLVYVASGFAISSDNRFVAMTRRELLAFFCSPTAYIFLLGFTIIAWMMFVNFRESLWQDQTRLGQSSALKVDEPIVINYLLGIYQFISVIIVVPVLTMRLLSEEKRSGTLEMLLTAPLNETAVVLSKFVAVLVLFMVLWSPLGLMLIGLRVEGGQPFDFRPVLSFYVALLFSGAGFLAMGLFFSSLTSNQLAAAIMTFVGMLVLTFVVFVENIVRRSASADDPVSVFLTHVSYVDLWVNAVVGKLALRDLFYHFSACIFWLFLSIKVLESRKWR
jgi:ABC-type transport system involved in multi-copper enzyme maturation permease subunit